MSTDTVRISPVKSTRRATSTSFANEAWTFPVFVWVVHWLITQVFGTLGYIYGTPKSMKWDYAQEQAVPQFGPESRAYQQYLPFPDMSGLAHYLVEPFRNWDGTWYHMVAQYDYQYGTADPAFWPLYPWLMNIVSDVTGLSLYTSGYLISRVAFLGALLFLYRLIRMDFDTRVTEWSLWAIALFPIALFFTAIYTESLFLCLVAGSLYYARKNQWLLAGVIGLLAALTRSAGVMLLAPFAILFIQHYGFRIRIWFPNAFPAALPALGPVIFGWYLTTKDKGFFDWTEQQWQWNRFSAMPWETFNCVFNGCTAEVRSFSSETRPFEVRPIDWGWIGDFLSSPTWSTFTSSVWRFRVGESYVFDLLVTVAAILLVIVGFRKVPLFYTAYVVPPILVPLFAPSSVMPLMSFPRFVLPMFPLFVVAVLLIRSQKVAMILGGISAVLLALFTIQFVQWYWVS